MNSSVSNIEILQDKRLRWMVAALVTVVLCWFYFFVERYGAARNISSIGWLMSAWNPETDYEHGYLFPFIIAGMIFSQRAKLSEVKVSMNYLGLFSVFIGAVFYVAAFRTFQPRVAIGALPFILWGSCLYLWGWQVARILVFPIFFLWLAIPLPSFQQATTHLQLLATALAHQGSNLFGVETKVIGTTILPINGNWQPLEIATGCSGIRSLMALLMISCAWAYVANIKLWQKAILIFSALPLAILGNALRVISIFIIAEYGDQEFGAGTWHDWSGLLLFYPFSIAMILGLHSIFEGGIPWKKKRRQTSRKRVTAVQS